MYRQATFPSQDVAGSYIRRDQVLSWNSRCYHNSHSRLLHNLLLVVDKKRKDLSHVCVATIGTLKLLRSVCIRRYDASSFSHVLQSLWIYDSFTLSPFSVSSVPTGLAIVAALLLLCVCVCVQVFASCLQIIHLCVVGFPLGNLWA